MTAPDFDPHIHFASPPGFGREVRMIRADAPELVALVKAMREITQSHAWQCFGECRGISETLLCPSDADENARVAIAAYETMK